ncbi:hypothetical protein JCM10908_001997 [Rhodotorula pacifica]|uniref:uncharacterized protein n=1 Tax=Rhodotorula pacifica TaxID=1495444 RepID=UPI00318239E4
MASVSQLRPPSSSSIRSTPLLARSGGTGQSGQSTFAVDGVTAPSTRSSRVEGTENALLGTSEASKVDRVNGSASRDPTTLTSTVRRLPPASASTSKGSLPTAAQGSLRRPQRLPQAKVGLTIPSDNSRLHNKPIEPTTPGRARRLAAHPTDPTADETFRKPAVPNSATRRAAAADRTPSRNRPLSQSISSRTPAASESPDTVRPVTRTISSSSLANSSRTTTPRKKAVVGGVARVPSTRDSASSDLSSSRGSRTLSSSTLSRSTSGLSSSTRTPLRASTSTSRPPSTLLATSQSRRTLTAPSTALRAGDSAATATVRRKAGALSAIPVPTTSGPGNRTLQRTPSVVSTASSRSAASSSQAVDPAPRREPVRAGSTQRRTSNQQQLGVSQTSRKSSWETVRSARNSLASSVRRRSSVAQPGGDADRSWETVESRRTSRIVSGPLSVALATPRRPSQTAPTAIVSPPSPPASSIGATQSGSTRISRSDVASPEDSDTTSHFSHAAFLSPLPPPAVNLLGELAHPSTGAARTKPRESTSLEEILRLGMLNQTRSGAQTSGSTIELELLLDEGSSRIMTEELRSSLGPPAPDTAASSTASPAPTTPWRGRVVSLGASARRRSVAASGAALESLAEDGAQGAVSPPSSAAPAGQVLLLRQSTAEASDLRRQVAALSAELERVKRERDEATSTVERDQQNEQEQVEALRKELEAAKMRESELRGDWEAERMAMEEDMAELATAAAATAAAATSAPPSAESSPHAASIAAAERGRLQLLLAANESGSAAHRAGSSFAEVETLAKREREDTRLAIASLQAIARGLEGWRVLL